MQAVFKHEGQMIDYTPVGAVVAGQVIVLGTKLVCVAHRPIDAGVKGALSVCGVYEVVKVTGALTAGDPIYWNATGDPDGGTAGTGAFTGTASAGVFAGYVLLSALSGDDTVWILLRSANVDATVTAFATMPTFPTATVAAAGSTQADAAAVATGFTLVTAADATKGVLLPVAAAGKVCIIKNIDAANAVLKIWPATGDGINAIAVNSAFSIAAKTSVYLIAYDATTWYSLPLLPS